MPYVRSVPRPSPSPRRSSVTSATSGGQGSGTAVGGPVEPLPNGEPGRVFLGFAYGFGIFAGVVLGGYGVFSVPAGPRVGGVLLSVGLAVAVVGNVAVGLLVRWLTGTRLGATIVLGGWIPAVLWLAASRPEGDLLLRASSTGYLFLILGSLSPVAAAVFGRTRRGMTALPPL